MAGEVPRSLQIQATMLGGNGSSLRILGKIDLKDSYRAYFKMREL
jgi:hypothetical protein